MDVKRALQVGVIAAAIALVAPDLAGARSAARWIIIVDDLHLDFRNTGQLRILLKTIAAELIHDGDEFALHSTGPSSVSIAWTDDRSIVDGAVKKVFGSALRVSDILAIRQGFLASNEVEHRASFALSRANEIIAGLDPPLDRGIGIIFVSNGYVDLPPPLTRAGGGARVPIFALDPRLLPGALVDSAGVDTARWTAYWAATRNSLRALSEQSGGFALAEGQDLAATLARISNLVRQ
jgi:hypothetical protein